MISAEICAEVSTSKRSAGLSVFPVSAFDIAQSMGETRAVNMVLIGALSAFLPLNENTFMQVIEKRMPDRIRKVNIEAFLKGKEILKEMLRNLS